MGSRHFYQEFDPRWQQSADEEFKRQMRAELAETNPIYLWFHGRWTVAKQKLLDGLTEEGATVKKRGRGYSDFNVIESLLTRGYLEIRRVGPRGGKRYFTSDAGKKLIETKAERC